MKKVALLDLKGRESSLGASIFKMGLLLKYINYKISEKKITQLLRREFKNSIFVAGAKHYEKMFDDFTNLNIVDDVLNAKEFLKEMYFNEELSIDMQISILNALSSNIGTNDELFYVDVIKDIFLVKNIRNSLDIIWFAESAFYYINKVEPKENQKDIFWLKELEDKSVMIMQNHIEFFYHPKLSNPLRFLTNPLIHNNDFNSSYIYTFPILINTDDEHKVTINMHYEDKNPLIDIIFTLKDNTIFSLESLPLSSLLQTFFKIFITYDTNFDAAKMYVYKIEDDDINSQIETIQFRYLKRNGDYYMIFNAEKAYHFDVGETFAMFEKIFLFSTLYFYKSKNICLKNLSGLSNKNFFYLVGLKG